MKKRVLNDCVNSPILEVKDRLNIESYAMCLALVASLRSEDPRHRVGAVGLTKTGRVIATGYNGLKAGKVATTAEWQDDVWRIRNILHAEVNLISMTPPSTLHTVAVTTMPCLACAKALVAHGIKRVLYGQIYKRDPEGHSVLEYNDVKVIRIPLTETHELLKKIRLRPR